MKTDRLLVLPAIVSVVLQAALCAGCASFQDSRSPAAALPMPITHITLYDQGLGQFERQVAVSGAQTFGIDLTAAHLDDLLASLLVSTDGAVQVQGVSYPMRLNRAQAVENSALGKAVSATAEEGGALDLAEYARAMRGLAVTVTSSAGRVEGTVLDCTVRKTMQPGEMSDMNSSGSGSGSSAGSGSSSGAGAGSGAAGQAPLYLALATRDGTLAWIAFADITGITPLSNREARQFVEYVSTLGHAPGFTEMALQVHTGAGSQGRLAASYIRQMPLWRMAYKISAKDDAVQLEAWALVHNDTTEAWHGVDLTLVAGLPSSYVVSLASPLYKQRESLALSADGSPGPQLGAATPDTLVYDERGEILSSAVSSVLGGHAVRYGMGGGAGGGGGYGMRGHGSAGDAETPSSLLAVGGSAAAPQIEAAVEKEISTFHALTPVDLAAGVSSMVPVLRAPASGRAYSVIDWDEPGVATCMLIENNTGLVLQPGLASFTINGRFRGEAQLERWLPGQSSTLCFGADEDIGVTTNEKEAALSKLFLEYAHDTLVVHTLRKKATTFSIENRAGQSRQVAIRVKALVKAQIVTPTTTIDGGDERRLIPLTLAARAKTTQEVLLEEAVMRAVDLSEQGVPQVDKLLAEPLLPNEQRTILKRVRQHLGELTQLTEKIGKKTGERARQEVSRTRLRENLQAVPQMAGQSRLVEKMLTEVMALEESLRRLDDELAQLESQKADVQQAMRKVLEEEPLQPTSLTIDAATDAEAR
jgi:hypothetical protein